MRTNSRAKREEIISTYMSTPTWSRWLEAYPQLQVTTISANQVKLNRPATAYLRQKSQTSTLRASSQPSYWQVVEQETKSMELDSLDRRLLTIPSSAQGHFLRERWTPCCRTTFQRNIQTSMRFHNTLPLLKNKLSWNMKHPDVLH